MGGAPRIFALHYEGSSKHSWRLVVILEPWTANSKPFFTANRLRTSTERRSAGLRPRTSASAIFRRRATARISLSSSALSHSVYSASAGAFLLAASGHYVWSLDSLRRAHFGNWAADDGAKSVGRGREA